MIFTPEFFLQLVASIGAGIGVYAGIKADLAVTRERASSALKSATDAHTRIDNILKGK